MSHVGRRIRNRRLAIDWTQAHLCREAGLSKGFLSDVENGKRGISAENLLAVGKALGLSLDYLMTGQDRPAWVRQVDDLLQK